MTVLDPLQTSPKHKESAVLDLKIDPQRIIAAMAKDEVTKGYLRRRRSEHNKALIDTPCLNNDGIWEGGL